VPLAPPAAPKQRPTPQVSVSQSTATSAEPSKSSTATKLKFVIKGLPHETKIEQLGDGVIRFGVRHLLIKVMRQGKQVLITDALNSREVRVDGTQCKVIIGDATVEVVGGNQLAFALSTSAIVVA
jgi:glucose/arabinose dehydrogenase